MKGKILFILAASMIFFQGCAPSKVFKVTTVEMTAVPYPDQKIGFDETVTSLKKHFVSMSPYSMMSIWDRTMFMMSVQNLGKEPVDISRDNITVKFKDSSGLGITNTLRVSPLHEVMSDFETDSKKKELEVIGAAFSGPLAAPRGNPAGANNFTDDSFNSPFTVQDAAFDLLGGMGILQTMHEQNQQILDAMPDFIMSPQIIVPGDTYTGVLVCNMKQTTPAIDGTFEISVSVDGDKHTFAFNRRFTTSKQGEFEAPVYNLDLPKKIKAQLSGEWNGILTMGMMQPTTSTVYVFRFEKSKTGDFLGSIEMPEQGGVEFSITDANMSDGKLMLKVKTIEGEFIGKISGDKIAGDWKQMGAESTPLTLNRGTYVPPVYPLNLPEEAMDQLAGNWNGKLNNMDITIMFIETDGGDFKGFFDRPQMNQKDLPITDASLSEGKLTLQIKTEFPSEFIGEIFGDKLIGDWKDMGKRTLLILDKERP